MKKITPLPRQRFGHEVKKTAEFQAWASAVQRCYNRNNPRYASYGGRGIYVCERWWIFRNFIEDMGERPEGTSLDRIDNDGPYSLGNCRWATRKEHQLNRRMNRWVIFRGEKRILDELSRQLSMNPNTVRLRIDRSGWSLEKALLTPARAHKINKQKG